MTAQPTLDAVQHLLIVADAVQRDSHVPERTKLFVKYAVADVLDGVPPAEAFGLAGGQGIRKATTRNVKGVRDAALRRALHHCGSVPKLLKAVRRFESTKWRRTRNSEMAPDDLTAVEASLWDAMHSGMSIPTSERGLRKAVKWPPTNHRN